MDSTNGFPEYFSAKELLSNICCLSLPASNSENIGIIFFWQNKYVMNSILRSSPAARLKSPSGYVKIIRLGDKIINCPVTVIFPIMDR